MGKTQEWLDLHAWEGELYEEALGHERGPVSCGRMIGPYACCSVIEGDCLELMKALGSGAVDAVITDPPYGMERALWDGKDFKAKLAPRLAECARVLKRGGWMFVFTSTGEVLSVGNLIPLEFRRMLWMYKPADITFPWRGWLLTSEAILAYSKGNPTSLLEPEAYVHDCYLATHIGMEGVEGHPTVKPLAVVQNIVSRINGITLDPYCGSGTTLVAAKKLGQHFLGFEISPEYCEIARKRLLEVEAQSSLFEAAVPKQMELELTLC